VTLAVVVTDGVLPAGVPVSVPSGGVADCVPGVVLAVSVTVTIVGVAVPPMPCATGLGVGVAVSVPAPAGDTGVPVGVARDVDVTGEMVAWAAGVAVVDMGCRQAAPGSLITA
jgi:hypothetical protein